jgi:hypothetical protein
VADHSISTVAREGRISRSIWIAMASAIALEAIVGLAELRTVALGRPSGWDPSRGMPIYLVHAVVGGLIGFVSIALFATHRQSARLLRLASIFGLVGVGVAGVGGVLAVYHPVRLIGMALMFIGAGTAFFGYLIPLGGRGKSDLTI